MVSSQAARQDSLSSRRGNMSEQTPEARKQLGPKAEHDNEVSHTAHIRQAYTCILKNERYFLVLQSIIKVKKVKLSLCLTN
jgi:hypothetical protein